MNILTVEKERRVRFEDEEDDDERFSFHQTSTETGKISNVAEEYYDQNKHKDLSQVLLLDSWSTVDLIKTRALLTNIRKRKMDVRSLPIEELFMQSSKETYLDMGQCGTTRGSHQHPCPTQHDKNVQGDLRQFKEKQFLCSQEGGLEGSKPQQRVSTLLAYRSVTKQTRW